MAQIEIRWTDLTPEAQKAINAQLHMDCGKEMNWDTFPMATVDIWTEDDDDPQVASMQSELEMLAENEYTPSATAGDYGPGDPWNAPGMSIHDFI